jgi:Na+-translocating ferredoxin:NAD+ oxidoreductase subunit A
MELISIAIASIFINNFVLSQFLGLCPFIGVSKKLDSVLGMGLAVIFVMTISSVITYLIYSYILFPNLVFLRTIVFILVIAALVQLIEIILKKSVPALYNSLGIYLPLITTNCAVMGVAVLNINNNYDFISSAVNGFSGGAGFLLALFLMAMIREKLEMADIPKAFKGAPIAFITAGLMAMAFFAADKAMLGFLSK